MSRIATIILAVLFVQGNAQLKAISAYPDTGMKPANLGLSAADMQPYNDPGLQYTAPFKIFDNLYYIGNKWVAAYLLETTDGLILIDALFGEHTALGVANMEKLGFQPEDIKYVLVTHGHFDHAAGAESFQRQYHSRIVMTAADWERANIDQTNPVAPFKAPRPDLVARDGDTLQLGNTEIKFYETPGHTEGVLSMEFMVFDGANSYRAFVFGGVGLNFSGVERTRQYLKSVDRIMDMADTPMPIAVNISNHPGVNKVIALRDEISRHEPGHHPMVSPEGFEKWLGSLKEAALVKLMEEENVSKKND
jgi:metallo-beta-lactamase class B